MGNDTNSALFRTACEECFAAFAFRNTFSQGLFMRPIGLIVLAIVLLSQSSTQGIGFDPSLAVNVVTKSGKVVEIKGPKINLKQDPDLDYRWRKPTILPNRDGRFTAVYYFGNWGKYWDALIYLVHPNGRVQRLRNDSVLDIKWTNDGKYLIGLGSNTLRLWNLNGGLRQASFQDIRSFEYVDQKLCLNLNWYSATTGQLNRTTEVQLAVPSLNQISEKDTDGQMTCGAR